MTRRTLRSWGLHPPHPQTAHPLTWQAQARSCLTEQVRLHGSSLPYGNGRSYGDSCLAASDHVIHTRSLDRIIAADWQTGTVVAEAGTTLAEVLDLSVPRGWFLPVTPGTKFVTLGGAVANDVHGKNHHRRGTFGRHVRSFGIVRSDRGHLTCTPQDNADLFRATIGGLGLTGIITWIEFQLIPIAASTLETVSIRFGSLKEFFDLSHEFDPAHEYTVSWVDCLAAGGAAGRGIFIAGNHAEAGALTPTSKAKLSIPFTLPLSAVNRLTLRLFNSAYYRTHPSRRRHKVVEYDSFFYPLDRILHWNRAYGRRGLQQFQCVIPDSPALPAVGELLATIAASGQGSFLAVLKRCGDIASPGLLSFPLPGISLALDFSQEAQPEKSLFPRLDAIVREAGGRLYPAKDAHMTSDDFRHFYPQWPLLEALRDPSLCSRFWKRVTAA